MTTLIDHTPTGVRPSTSSGARRA